MKESFKQFFYLLDRKAKKALPYLIISFFVSSVLDVIGIGLIGVFIALLLDPTFLLNKIPSLEILLPSLEGKNAIIIFGILLIVAIILKSLAVVFIQKKMYLFAQKFSFRLKSRLVKAYQYAPYIYHLQKNSNDLLSRIQENINGFINNLLMPSLTLISSVLMTLFILLFLLVLHPISTIVLLALFICVGLGYDLLIKKDLSAMGKIIAESGGSIYKCIKHSLYGLVEVRVLNREKYFVDQLEKKYYEHLEAGAIVYKQQLMPRYLIENMIAIFTVTLGLGGLALGYKAASIVALVGVFGVAGARLLPTVTQVMISINQFRSGYRNLSLVYNEFKEIEQLTKSSQQELTFDRVEKQKFSKIQLKRLHYQYPKTNVFVLKDISMEIYKGQSIGLVGPTGAGKSTLVNVILGFLEPQQGQLLIDGKPITNLRSWLNNFAYIPQSIFLLDDSLCRNIAFGIDDDEISHHRLWNAINMAKLTEVVENLPQGIDTSLGENGIRLSGGQRQRVALARAFYNERDIIVMDEATSSLDNDTEREVISTIKKLKGEKTLIVIAHRLSTVEHCDVLYRLDRGTISKTGTFQEVVG